MQENIDTDTIGIQQRRAANNDGNTETPSTSVSFNQTIASTFGSYVLTTGKDKAQKALNIYSHIDYLRPYFDVEPIEVLYRLANSISPIHIGPMNDKLPTELYGPLMIIFTLGAILIYQMKMANHSIEDGTLIGTAFFVCFSYWLGTSFLLSTASFICNSTVSLFNLLSIVGYSLFSHCFVLFIGTFIHTSFDHFIFYALWLIVGGAAALKLAFFIFKQTPHPQHRFSLAVITIVLHLGFLLYLHFAYHELAEEISHALFNKPNEYPPMYKNVIEESKVKQEAQKIPEMRDRH